MTPDPTAQDMWRRVAPLARTLVSAWGAWAPVLTADGTRVAYVSDRSGVPRVWVQDVDGTASSPREIVVGDPQDPVVAVAWSADSAWLGVSVAFGGGVRTEVWVVRPDGTDAHRVAGGGPAAEHVRLAAWDREGAGLLVTRVPADGGPHECLLVHPVTDRREVVAVGGLIDLLDVADHAGLVLLRDGTRGAQFCRLVERAADVDRPVLPYDEVGATDVGLLRRAPEGHAAARVVYLVTDAGRPRREVVAVGVDAAGERIAAGTIAARDDAEAEFLDADDAGTLLLIGWNVAGRSALELVDAVTGARRPVELPADGPGEVVSGLVLTRDGRYVVAAVEGPASPRRLWRYDVAAGRWAPLTPASLPVDAALVVPELVRLEAHDGLELTGWLYRAARGSGAAALSLHGGPEAQERPAFSPAHQVLAAAGITVFAPNIRGSSGFGRAFVHADDRYGRYDALDDIADCARALVSAGGADPARIAVTGRSYGGYATVMSLVRHGPLFAAGVDICGMTDLAAFYRETEPWIAAAAVSKYGDPQRDAALLADLSPLHRAEVITAPLLVVHGELDTNVPLGEARRLVARLRELDRDVEYLELAGEGHEYRRTSSQLTLLERLTTFLLDRLARRGTRPTDVSQNAPTLPGRAGRTDR